MPTIQYGMTGSAVRQLQQALVDHNYDIDVDGDFGDNTFQAVSHFQEANDLDVDGIAGPRTLAALGLGAVAHSSSSGGSRHPMLERGSEGRSVRVLQEALVELGYEIDVDGDFGRATEQAVLAFQEANDLDVDGIVGPNTWEALGV
ncbi:MAG: peptidoglycan-binding protein [Deltaproteobacteria bacterium]|nr:peptidoglycan-binding protein [Myxococcales bacterium]MDP3220458.1 peptidoglycan-binding protein [Deltaproteobacteria bacterium]